MQSRSRLSYANVVATIALVFAVGGASAFAATQLGKNSVGPRQLKKNAVTTAKIKDAAVTEAKIKDGAISGAKVNLASLGTVPSARSADTLGGIGPGAFPRVARSARGGVVLLGQDGVVGELNINAPQGGFLLIIASADVFREAPGSDLYNCGIELDGNNVIESSRTSQLEGVANADEDCGTNTVQPVSAGSHNVRFNFFNIGSETAVATPELDVVFIPFAG